MALSNQEILDNKKRGTIIISPFKKDNVNTASYDVTLGPWYYREQTSKYHHPIYNPYQESHTRHVWGSPQKAERADKVLQKYQFRWDRGIKSTDKIILLRPGETILGHTQEFIGGRECVTTQMQARSSIGRNFIEVCKCAGWGDVGYINRWTMEITNNSQHYMIPLVVGRRVAQIVFYKTGPITGSDYTQTKGSKYDTLGDLKELKKTWGPDMMLPKLWKDRELTE